MAGYLASVTDPSAIEAVEAAAANPTPGGISSSFSRSPGGSQTPGSTSEPPCLILSLCL